MKKIIILFGLLTLNSCKPKTKERREPLRNTVEPVTIPHKMKEIHDYNNLVDNKFEKFDIERFNKNKDREGYYIYILNDGSSVMEYGYADQGYYKDITKKNSVYTVGKAFYLNGNIQVKGVQFKDTCEIGIWYEFDESGKLIKTTDLDKDYRMNIEEMVEFLKNSKANFNLYCYINRATHPVSQNKSWNLEYFGEYKEKVGHYAVYIDDCTGKAIKVVEITGKHGEHTILYSKEESIGLGTPYKGGELPARTYQIYDEVAYTKEEWNEFVKTQS